MESIYGNESVAALHKAAMYEKDANRVNIMSTESGKVFLIALKREESLSKHTAPGDAMVYAVEGRVVFSTDKGDLILNAGDFFTMPKGTLHSVNAIEDSKFLLTIFK